MLVPIKLGKQVTQILEDNPPKAIVKTRRGAGGKELSYVSGNYVIDVLNRAFGYNWDWTVKKCWIEQFVPWTKRGYQGSPDEVKEDVGSVAHVLGTLKVRLHDDTTNEDIVITKSGLGSKSIIGNQAEQESIYKAAMTDAIKKAASLLGIAADLYRDDNERNHFNTLKAQELWTDKETHKRQKDFDLINSFGWTSQYLSQVIKQWSNGSAQSLYALTPEQFDQFMVWIRAVMEQQRKS